jgi:hypothetical protein
MTKGDSVICIKDHCYNLYYFIRTGNKYEIIDSGNDSVYIKVDFNKNKRYEGLWFSFIEEQGNLKKFSDYFITIAEYREQQIKTVLDD